MVKTYLFLAGAVFFEVAGTMLLPITQNFTKLMPTVALAFFYLCAFYLLTFVADKIPIAIMYATWSGLGIFTIAILGYIFFKQTLAKPNEMGDIVVKLPLPPGTFPTLWNADKRYKDNYMSNYEGY